MVGQMAPRSLLSAAVVCALPLAACSGSGDDQRESEVSVGRIVQSWRQDSHLSLETLTGLVARNHPVLVVDAAQRTALRSRAPDLDWSQVAGADLATSILVVGGYDNCMAASLVDFAPKEKALRFRVSRDKKVNCAWAPYTVDVWAIPRSDLGGLEPAEMQVIS